MSTHEQTLAVIERFYDAALDQTLWPAVLKDLANLTGSQAASFWVLDGSANHPLPTFISINFDTNNIQEYLNKMASLDPTVRYLVEHPQQRIVHDGLLASPDQNERAYNDWHERNIETRYRMVGQAHLAPAVQAGVALHRTERAGPYEPGDIDRFALLNRHLERALAIGFQLDSLRTMQQFGAEWLDRSEAAVVLLDERKRIIFTTRSAQALEGANDGIRFERGGGIALGRKRDNDKLASLIAQTLTVFPSPGGLIGGTMRAERPSGKRPYGISVVPISKQSSALALKRPAVCIVITDPERQALLPVHRLQAAFDLTGAEARLAALLAAGEELRHAAEQLHITYGTARTRLAQIFQKTGTRRQGELIRLALTMLAVG